MQRLRIYYLTFFLLSFINSLPAQVNNLQLSENVMPGSFQLIDKNSKATFYYDKADAKVVGIAAEAFREDIRVVSGKELSIINELPASKNSLIVAGTIGSSKLIDDLIASKKINVSAIKDKWESFKIEVFSSSTGNSTLVIAGSDRRGTAYGIFHLSRLMGVSPFVWWADAVPEKKEQLFISGSYTSKEPSVQYRGIFINDEDWGLQPWAAKNMDTDIKDIGPKTYAKVFELLLRLKANYVWPAMHPCTKAFYYYKENPEVADDYAIVVGSSHAEPMLRNNVFEWAVNFENEYGKKPGEWRYDTNKDVIHAYWNDRVKQAVNYESVFTVGMRGVHDSGMPGPKDAGEKLKLLEQIITDQRQILQTNFKRSADKIPQIFVPYKEVLSLYRKGMKLPDDITIIWPDDNHGYIRQLPNDAERKRSGGHGVYYHLSYWGVPQDYLWLSSISPSLIAYEMNKAYRYGAKKLWVFNVGDIKPAELEMQFAMDLAWDVTKWPPEKAHAYIYEWAKEIFGVSAASNISLLKNWYYELATSGKPEHMNLIELSYLQSRERSSQYSSLSVFTENMQREIPAHLRDAYYELMYYPAEAAALMNFKILNAKFSFRPDSNNESYNFNGSMNSRHAFAKIQSITNTYNRDIASGKWDGIMSWHPRDLPVFKMPVTADSGHQLIKDSVAKKYFNTSTPELIYLASSPIRKMENANARIRTIKGLGISGTGITTDQSKALSTIDAPYIEFDLSMPPSLAFGVYNIIVKCLPTFDVNHSKQLRYSIAVNNEKSQTANVHAEADSKEWKENVIRGYSAGKTTHVITGKSKLRIWFNDPGLVISTIEFYRQ